MATQSKTWVYGHSLAGIAGLNLARAMDVRLLLVLRVFRYRSLRPAQCGVSECDRETS